MTINYTTLLGLAQPVTGTETGQWGDVVNDEITSLLEDAVANAATFSVTSGNVTLTTTNGASNQARMSTLIITGTPGTTRNVVAPSQAKIYQVINQSDGAVVIKGSATTGVTIAAGATGTVVWNGSDFVEINSTSSGRIIKGNVQITGNLQVDGNTQLGNSTSDTLAVTALVNASLLFTDNTYDIGANGATRPRTGYFGTSVLSPLFTGTNIQVSNIKANDGTAAITIADSTGAIAISKNLTIGDASTDTLTVTSTITSNLLFTDNTYDIGASGATRPRNLYLAGLLTMGGALTVNGNTTLGDANTDTLSVNALVNTNLQFVDNTYDIGASNAYRPRNLFLGGAIAAGGGATLGGNLTITKNSGTSELNIYAGSAGTALMSLTSGGIYGHTLKTDSGGTLDFIRDTTRYMLQTVGQQNWFNDTYIYSSTGGATGQVRAGIYMNGTSQTLNIFTGGNSRIAVNPFGNTFVAAGNSITTGSSNTYAFGVGNDGDGATVTLGSASGQVYMQTWGGKQLYINPEGNKIRIGGGSQVGVNTNGDGPAATSTASMTINYHTAATSSEHVLSLMYNNTMSSGNNVYMSFGQGTANQLARIAGVYEGGVYSGGLYFYTNRGSDGANPTLSAKIDAAGRMLTPNNPGFFANGAGYNGQYFKNQPVGNYVTGVGSFNVGGNFSPRASGGTARFTAPVAGYYFFTAGALWYGGGSLTQPRTLALQVNGSVACNNYSDSGQVPITMTVSAVLYLNANDYVEAYCTGTQDGWYGNGATSGNYDGSAYNFFSGYLVG